MLKGNEGPELRCENCGVTVFPRCGGYWFILLQQRGRCRFPGVTDVRAVLCSGCGRRAREALECAGVAGAAYRVSPSKAREFMTGP